MEIAPRPRQKLIYHIAVHRYPVNVRARKYIALVEIVLRVPLYSSNLETLHRVNLHRQHERRCFIHDGQFSFAGRNHRLKDRLSLKGLLHSRIRYRLPLRTC